MIRYLAASPVLALASPAAAEVVQSTPGGFASHHEAVVATPPAETWAMLVEPQRWWSHTWSDNSANLRLVPQAGGCFCEVIPATGDDALSGSVEHARVVAVFPYRMLRMVGALGPLQSEGLAGTLTVTLAPEEEGTRIAWDYVIGGQSRTRLETFAPVVDGVNGAFLGGLVDALGGEVTAPE